MSVVFIVSEPPYEYAVLTSVTAVAVTPADVTLNISVSLPPVVRL